MSDVVINGQGRGAARSVPPGDDAVSRRLRALEEMIQQNLAAMRVMVDPLAQAIADLEEQQTTLSGVVDDLATQQTTLSGVVDDLGTAQTTLSGVVSDLSTTQDDLADTVADLTTVQGTLSTTVSGLAAAVSDISDLVDEQVQGDSGTNNASPTLTTTVTSYASVSLTVPAGYTKAEVIGLSVMYAGGIVASTLRTRIDGDDGPEMFAFTNQAYANATAGHARSLTGLSGGGTISVSSRAATTTGSTSAVIITVAMAIFSR